MKFGGVPERSNGAVLKTAGGRKVARGFKSHPRRLSSHSSTAASRAVRYLAGQRRGHVCGTHRERAPEQPDRWQRSAGEREQRQVVVRRTGAGLPAHAWDPLGLPVEEPDRKVVRDAGQNREQIVVERQLSA